MSKDFRGACTQCHNMHTHEQFLRLSVGLVTVGLVFLHLFRFSILYVFCFSLDCFVFVFVFVFAFECFDAVGWAVERASGL